MAKNGFLTQYTDQDQGATNTTIPAGQIFGPESPLGSSHAALPVNSYGLLLGSEINRKWGKREEVVSV